MNEMRAELEKHYQEEAEKFVQKQLVTREAALQSQFASAWDQQVHKFSLSQDKQSFLQTVGSKKLIFSPETNTIVNQSDDDENQNSSNMF